MRFCIHYYYNPIAGGIQSMLFILHEKNSIFCSRDRFGVKPFYYFTDDNKFIFASEIKPILEIEKITEVNMLIDGLHKSQIASIK